jgi:hypothetical protein
MPKSFNDDEGISFIDQLRRQKKKISICVEVLLILAVHRSQPIHKTGIFSDQTLHLSQDGLIYYRASKAETTILASFDQMPEQLADIGHPLFPGHNTQMTKAYWPLPSGFTALRRIKQVTVGKNHAALLMGFRQIEVGEFLAHDLTQKNMLLVWATDTTQQ